MNPAEVIATLETIERELEAREPALENAARGWHRAKREREHAKAVAFISAEGPMDLRKATADRESCLIGMEAEAEWEAIRAVVNILIARGTIGQSLLKIMGRGA